MLRKTYLYVKEVTAESVVVELADFAQPLSLPRELFSEEIVAQCVPGAKLIGRVNTTRAERKLVVAGPFEFGVEKKDAGPDVSENDPNVRAAHTVIWSCRQCGLVKRIVLGHDEPHDCKQRRGLTRGDP